MITYVSRLWGMLAHQEGCVTGPASRALLSACCIEWNAPPPSGRIEKQPQLFRRMAHFFQLLWTLEDSEFVEFSSRILRAMFSNWKVVMFAWPSRIKSSLDSFLVEITFFPFLTPLLTPSLTFPFSLLWTFPPPLSPILMSCTLHFLLSTSHYSVIWNCDFLLISAWLIIFSCSQCEYTGSIIFFSFCLKDFPGGARGKELACQWRRCKRCWFDSWVGTIPWRRAWQPTPLFLPEESHGQRSLVGYGP